MFSILAKIYFFTEKEGGRSQDAFTGYMPSLSVNGELIMCRILSEQEILHRGTEYKVKIELPYGEMYKEYFFNGYSFTLNEGGWTIGKGKIIKVLGEKSH
jgi:translation elongation factor EF-Tu-like GTPase